MYGADLCFSHASLAASPPCGLLSLQQRNSPRVPSRTQLSPRFAPHCRLPEGSEPRVARKDRTHPRDGSTHAGPVVVPWSRTLPSPDRRVAARCARVATVLRTARTRTGESARCFGLTLWFRKHQRPPLGTSQRWDCACGPPIPGGHDRPRPVTCAISVAGSAGKGLTLQVVGFWLDPPVGLPLHGTDRQSCIRFARAHCCAGLAFAGERHNLRSFLGVHLSAPALRRKVALASFSEGCSGGWRRTAWSLTRVVDDLNLAIRVRGHLCCRLQTGMCHHDQAPWNRV